MNVHDSGAGREPIVPGRALALVLLLAAPALAFAAPLTIDEGVLDHIVIHGTDFPEDVGVVVRRFPADEADLGTGDSDEVKHAQRKAAAEGMQKKGPTMLAAQIVTELTGSSAFRYVKESEDEAPEDAVVVEGRFTMIQPGSRAKRWLVGFGKGKSGIRVEGTIKTAKGELLAEFTHMRNSGIGLAGGDYEKFLTDDTRDVGTDIAAFLKRWATGKSLSED